MLKKSWAALFFLVSISVIGQNYNIKQYRILEGLHTDVIKAVNQDSLGFLWIATDDGLVKYDGINFTTYKSALKSKYVKAFLKTRQNKLLVIGDCDFVEIQNQLDTVVFKSLVDGSYNITDSTISYPKTLFQDIKNDIWLAESESIVKYKDGKIKRYNFGRDNGSNNFSRSFQFFEDKEGNFYTVTYGGKVFVFDRLNDLFVPLAQELCEGVNHIIYQNKRLFIASNSGLYTATIDNQVISDLAKTNFPFDLVSNLLLAPDSSLWVGNFAKDLTRIQNINDLDNNRVTLNIKRAKATFRSDQGDYWISTDKGVILVKDRIFEIPDKNSDLHFVECITQSKVNNEIYFCDKLSMYYLREISKSEWRTEKIFTTKNGYLQSITENDNGLWLTNAYGVMLFKNKKPMRSWDFADQGHYIFDILSDAKNNIWIAQFKSKHIISIDNNFKVKKYQLDITSGADIQVLAEGENGIFAGTKGSTKEYLFFKANNSEVFKNISLTLGFDTYGEFQILSMAIKDDAVWLATSQGLLVYRNNKIERINLGEKFTGLNVSSVTVLNKENILFANAFGLFRYDILTKEYCVYDENTGLPSNTITDHGIIIDNRKNVWLGTSHGLAYAGIKSLLKSRKTPTPYCVGAVVNGKSELYRNGLSAPYGSYINLLFSSISFPEDKIGIEWKMKGDRTGWKELKNRELSLSDLKSGKYEILARAKNNTGLEYSDSRSLFIAIGKPFWVRPDFILLVCFSVLSIIFLSYLVSSRIMQKRREYLQALVSERTRDLEIANQELSQRNLELDRFVYSASHDLGAPLKSLLGLISIAKMEGSITAINKYLGLMETSVKKLDDFIKEVINYSRNSRMELKYEPIDFKPFVNTLLEDHNYAENFGKITFIIEDRLGEPMVSDISRLKVILNNLISNAIKFQRTDSDEKPFVKISLEKNNQQYILIVEDNGRGIASEYQEAIFDMFFRATVEVQGSGLGLYILKETVQRLNSTYKVDSELGKGTRFTICIPITG